MASPLTDLASEVRARVSIVDIAGRYTTLKQRGRGDWWGCCPFHGEKTPSFHCLQHQKRFFCFGCGASGDVISFVMGMERKTFKIALLGLAEEFGLAPVPDGQVRPRPPERIPVEARAAREDIGAYVEWCRAQWRAAAPGAGTLVEVYLRSRAITLPVPPTLRFAMMRHSDSGLVLPCMVAAVQGPDRSVIGIHRTYLRDDGQGKALVSPAKKMAGIMIGGAIRLAPASDVMCFGEGIESTLSVMQDCPGLAGWAAGSLGNLAGAGRGPMTPHPRREGVKVPDPRPDMGRPGIAIPAECREAILLGDSDSDPEITGALMARAETRQRIEGRIARIAWADEGQDFNDMLQARARATAAA
ncbi:DUF7146 domain-containing protein [Zavarzinia aquatilis]|uniref:Zinc finger CHC2-type domain-containing protein n=1 Tax=Zavarzinia aquatilis TaxID=2211142 RepID=A0A317EBW5_9PROT|nr:CHC2 zinc finger domain-containing protein [Zavarzinia aquatilis]PWR24558.1 hypothetical protein DKG74_07065 [Zavarzinia aquatilis]